MTKILNEVPYTENARLQVIQHADHTRLPYADAATDMTQDDELPTQPLPMGTIYRLYGPRRPMPPAQEPKPDWVTLATTLALKQLESKKFPSRDISAKEQRKLPAPFNEPPNWPVRRITGQRDDGSLEYLVEWEPHPLTGEEWTPSWVSPNLRYRIR